MVKESAWNSGSNAEREQRSGFSTDCVGREEEETEGGLQETDAEISVVTKETGEAPAEPSSLREAGKAVVTSPRPKLMAEAAKFACEGESRLEEPDAAGETEDLKTEKEGERNPTLGNPTLRARRRH